MVERLDRTSLGVATHLVGEFLELQLVAVPGRTGDQLGGGPSAGGSGDEPWPGPASRRQR